MVSNGFQHPQRPRAGAQGRGRDQQPGRFWTSRVGPEDEGGGEARNPDGSDYPERGPDGEPDGWVGNPDAFKHLSTSREGGQRLAPAGGQTVVRGSVFKRGNLYF